MRLPHRTLGGGLLFALMLPVAALDLSPALEPIPTVEPSPAVLPPPSPGACAPANDGWQSFGTFIGALHEHSGYSDGWPETTPADYFAQIRARGFDFAGSAEHSDNARVPVTFNEACLPHEDGTLVECVNRPPEEAADNPEAALDPVNKWDATLRQARAASGESFTAFRGFEWTSDRFGHINVYFSRNDANAKADGGHATMESFWTWFTTRPELGGGAGGLATFNHPGREDTFTTADPGFNWNDFAFVPQADLRMVGIEVFNRRADFGTLRDNVPSGHPGWYVHALGKGWHLGPIGAEDEHDTDWGTPTRGKTILISRDRTASALREALLARRFYAVGPDHNDLRLAYTIDRQPMGARLARPAGAKLRLRFEIIAGAYEGRVELVTNGGVIAAATNGAALNRRVRVAAGGERWYFVRVLDKGGNPIAYTAPVWIRAGGAYPVCGEWIAGDLHVHTTYSHDSWGGPNTPDEVPLIREIIPGDDNTGIDEFYTLGHTVERQFRIAAARGLDYLAISDHDDIRSRVDPGFGAHGVVAVGSYESSFHGHANMHGAQRLYDRGDRSRAAVQAAADALRADGGVFQINHPALGSTNFPADADWELFRGGYDADVVPDVVEIWNISWLYKPPLPSASSMDDAVRYWEGWLDLGHKVGATGGSDNHWLSTTAVQGNGQPTTWVFVTERSERGVLDGLRRGRTFITHQPPLLRGPSLVLEADADGRDGFESMTGDEVPVGAALRARVENAAGTFLRLVTDGGQPLGEPVFVTGSPFTHAFDAPAGATWVRAELVEPDAAGERAAVCADPALDPFDPLTSETTYCRNRVAVLAMSSALYLR